MKNIASGRKHEQGSNRLNCKIATKSSEINDHHQDIHKRPRQCLDLELPAEEYIPGTEGNDPVQIGGENELELTLGLGPTSNCRRKASDTSLPLDSAASFSSSSTRSSHIKRSDSVYQQTNAIRDELIGRKWGLDLPSSNPSVLVARKHSSDIEEQLRRDRHNNPPWFLQALSLNST